MSAQARRALDRLIAQKEIRTGFPPAVDAEVAALAADPGIADPALTDLTHLPFVTIDNQDSMDLDQALHIEPKGDGHTVRYALADAAHYVRPGTALFAEALKRGTSYYLPGLCVPMLPRALSEDLVSLNPRVDRRALVFVMELDGQGMLIETRLERARIHSRAKLTYDGVQAHHDAPQASPLAGHDYSETLDLLAVVGRRRMAEARTRDVVPYNRVEVEVELSDDGARFVVTARERNEVSMWNEQISLLCNMEGARMMASAGGAADQAQPIFRVHDAPTEESLVHLERVIARMAALHGLDPARWVWRRGQVALADFLEGLPADEAPAVRAAVERQILISNQRSMYAAEPGLHYALGVASYSRFSSPMREVVGIFTHKEALEKLGWLSPSATPDEDVVLRDRVIQSANQARERQGQLTKGAVELAVAQTFDDDLHAPEADRPVYAGTLLGLRPSRLYVRLDDPPIEIKIYVPDLERRLGVSLVLSDDEAELAAPGAGPRFRVGDRLRLRLVGRDKARGRYHLAPVS